MGKSYHMTKSSFTYFFGHFKILSVFVSTNETGHKFHNWSVIHTLWIQQNKLNCRKKWLGVPRRGLFERDYHPAQNWPASFTDTKTQKKLTRYSEFWSGFFAQKSRLVPFPIEFGINDLQLSVKVCVMKYGASLSKKFLNFRNFEIPTFSLETYLKDICISSRYKYLFYTNNDQHYMTENYKNFYIKATPEFHYPVRSKSNNNSPCSWL